MDNFGNPTGTNIGFFGAAASVGGIVSCIFSGPLTDYFGRKAMVCAGATLIVGMAFMESFSSSFHMFIGGKLLIGLGSFFQQVSAPMLVTKLAYPKQREVLSSLYNTSIFIGLIIGGWTTFGTYPLNPVWAWRLPCMLQVILPMYQAIAIWLVPESPRWLVSKGRIEEARRILIKYHGNGEDTELVQLELQEIIAGIEADKTQATFSIESVKDVFRTKGNRHRLWPCVWTAVGSQTVGGGFTATFLSLILDQIGMKTQTEQILINALLNVWNWVCAIGGAFLIPKFGRRPIFIYATLGTNVTFIVWTVLSALYSQTNEVGLGIGVLTMIIANSPFTAVCWVPLVIAYPLETVTTKQRGVYFGITMFVINASTFVNTYMIPVGIENIGWRYYIPTCVWNAILLAVVYFTFVETRGLTLEEIATIFDGHESFDNANVAVRADMTEKGEKEKATHHKVFISLHPIWLKL